jgi:hypothetical protein
MTPHTCVFNMIKGGCLYTNTPERICGKPATKEIATDWFCNFHYDKVADWFVNIEMRKQLKREKRGIKPT